jgi:hypothetical protein
MFVIAVFLFVETSHADDPSCDVPGRPQFTPHRGACDEGMVKDSEAASSAGKDRLSILA